VAAPKRGRVALSARVKLLAKDIKARAGKLAMPGEAFDRWSQEHAGLKGAERAARAHEVLGLAVRFHREGGPDAAEATGQLYLLAAALMKGSPPSRGTKKGAGGWAPR
jgi:hypothetical protein